MSKKNIRISVILIVLTIFIVCGFKIVHEVNENKECAKYISWFEKEINKKSNSKEWNNTIAYINDVPISYREVIPRALVLQINNNSLNKLSTDKIALTDDSIDSAFSEIIISKAYELYFKDQNENVTIEKASEILNEINEIEKNSSIIITKCTALIRIKYPELFKSETLMRYFNEIIQQKNENRELSTEETLEEYEKLFNEIISEVTLTFEDNAPNALKNGTTVKELKKRNTNILNSN